MKLLIIIFGIISVSFAQDKIIKQFEVTHKISSPQEARISLKALATPNEFPFLVGLLISENRSNNTLIYIWCSGSLINNKIVLTAASCLQKAEFAIAFLGGYDLHQVSLQTVQTFVSKNQWIIHPEYNSGNSSADIAVISLSESVLFTEAIQPLHLLTRKLDDSKFVGRMATVPGWENIGNIQLITRFKTKVQFSNLKILPPEICENVYNIKEAIPLFDKKNQFCVDGSVCPEDFGSPLVVWDNSNNVATLVGIASFGLKNECQNGMPIVFTRISSYLKWLDNIISLDLTRYSQESIDL